MFQLDLHSKKSIYEQVVDGVKTAIVTGEFKTDEKLPSVRDLSAKLMVNPNTVAKAFKSLEQQGWIYTVSGRGCFVSGEKHLHNEAAASELLLKIAAAKRELLYMGLTKEEIDKAVSELLKKGEEQT